MKKDNTLNSIFSQIEDPRNHINKLHLLNDIIFIGITAVICGAETWSQMVTFAKSKESFLKSFLDLPNGIPSEDTINRVFSAIDSDKFEHCFIDWKNTVSTLVKGQVIAIDDKTLKGAKSNGLKSSPIHMVSAWAHDKNLVLGQVKVNEKSNAITAIPELLKILSIEESIITIDAMECQTKIADQIIECDADYILAVRGNQEELLEQIIDEFRFSKTMKTNRTVDCDHGRIETRTCAIVTEFTELKLAHKWKNLKTIIRIQSKREFKNSNKTTETSTRYYISSLDATAADFQKAIRSHWSIENKLHWTLDVAFGEDASRKRKGNAAQNYSILLKIALNLIKNEKSAKQSVKTKRLRAAWDNDFLLKILDVKV